MVVASPPSIAHANRGDGGPLPPSPRSLARVGGRRRKCGMASWPGASSHESHRRPLLRDLSVSLRQEQLAGVDCEAVVRSIAGCTSAALDGRLRRSERNAVAIHPRGMFGRAGKRWDDGREAVGIRMLERDVEACPPERNEA